MLYHIAWFNEAPVEPRLDGGLTSDSETVCRRCLLPARALEQLGLECSVFGNLADADPTQVNIHLQKLQCEIVVIGEFDASSAIPLARAAKHLGCYVIADIDKKSVASKDLVKLAEIVDHIVASSRDVATIIGQLTGHIASIIPDCEERSTGAHSPMAIARLWLDDFKRLRLKPPVCANTNEPVRP